MTNLKEALAKDITEGITKAIEAKELSAIEKLPVVTVERAENSEHGDYASAIALSLTKQMQKPPLEIVETITRHMPKKEYIGKIEAAPPGFLNIRLSPAWMIARLDNIIREDVASESQFGQGKSVNLEFISANPTGPLTLGNIRPAFSADTLGNVLSAVGYNVTREYYINDAGEQARKLGESVLRRILQAQGQSLDYPEELYQGKYIEEIGQQIGERYREDEGKIFEEADLGNREVVEKVSQEAMTILLNHIKKTIGEELKIHFDVWTSEVSLRQSGAVEKTLEKLRARKALYEKDGAEYLMTSKFGDDQDRVVVKSDKEYAYFAPDIAYHQGKYDRGYDLIFTFLGADHQGHIPRLRAAMQALGNDVHKLHFIVGQWVRLIQGGKEIKLSKRRGQLFGPEELIADVGYDVTRFFFVMHRLESHMDFDLDLAREQSERNPVYYVQYAFVRLQSILRRAKEAGIIQSVGESLDLSAAPKLAHSTEMALMKVMYQWPEVLREIADSFTVHQLAYYAQELAKAIHVFYKNVPVLNAENRELVLARLELTLAARKVLGETLQLLGITQPDVM